MSRVKVKSCKKNEYPIKLQIPEKFTCLQYLHYCYFPPLELTV